MRVGKQKGVDEIEFDRGLTSDFPCRHFSNVEGFSIVTCMGRHPSVTRVKSLSKRRTRSDCILCPDDLHHDVRHRILSEPSGVLLDILLVALHVSQSRSFRNSAPSMSCGISVL